MIVFSLYHQIYLYTCSISYIYIKLLHGLLFFWSFFFSFFCFFDHKTHVSKIYCFWLFSTIKIYLYTCSILHIYSTISMKYSFFGNTCFRKCLVWFSTIKIYLYTCQYLYIYINYLMDYSFFSNFFFWKYRIVF